MRLTIIGLLAGAAAVSACARPSFDTFFGRGERYLQSRQYAAAAIEFQNAVRAQPRSPEAQMKLGDVYSAMSQPANAAAAYDRACAIDERNVKACVNAAAALLGIGDYENAAARARTVLTTDQFDLDAQLILASALAGVRRFADAEERLQAAIAAVRQEPRLYRALADVQRQRGNLQGAEQSLERAITLAPRSPEARVDLANLYLADGRTTDGARQLRAALEADPADVAANRAYASYLTQTGQCGAAEAYWQKVAAGTPDGSGAVALADYYVFAGRSDDALHVLQTLVAGSGNHDARGRMAALLYDRGDRVQAARVVNDLLAEDEANVDGLVLKARLSLSDHDTAAAREYLHKAAAVNPDAPAVRDMLAVMSSQP